MTTRHVTSVRHAMWRQLREAMLRRYVMTHVVSYDKPCYVASRLFSYGALIIINTRIPGFFYIN